MAAATTGDDAEMNIQNSNWPSDKLREKAMCFKVDVNSKEFAKLMDEEDPLARFRQKFCIPKMKDLPYVDQELIKVEDDCIYFCGNSLGLKPKSADRHMAVCLNAWANWGAVSYICGELPSFYCDKPGIPATARLVGANPNEVALMNGLTVNLNLLLASFYKPTEHRFKILMEAKAFPSDLYAVKSHIRHHGHDPESALIQLSPREGEHYLRTEDILKTIEIEGNTISVVMFSGVQHFTGQKFDMKSITNAGQDKGCIVGFDLAHAIGNVKLNLHEWGVDFACWCSYKYLNSGAGGLAGAFIHEKHDKILKAELHGWWGNSPLTRLELNEEIELETGVAGLRMSNPPPWLACLNLASLEIFEETSMDEILAKQFLLTGYLECLLDNNFDVNDPPILTIITPRDPEERGSHLSFRLLKPIKKVHEELQKRGMLCDIRKPDVLRVAPVPLYNTFLDVFYFVQLLKQIIQ